MAKDSKHCSSRRCGGLHTAHTVTIIRKKDGRKVHEWVCCNCGKVTVTDGSTEQA